MGFIETKNTTESDLADNQISVDISYPLREGKDVEKEHTQLYPVVTYVKERYNRAKTKRMPDENRWLTSYRNYRGLYGPDVMFTDTEKSRVFIKVTKTKVLAAFAQVVDVLFAGNKFPIAIESSPVPNGNLPEAVYIDPEEPKENSGSSTVRPELKGLLKSKLEKVEGLKEGSGLTASSATWEPNKIAAKKMEKKIHDQLEESDASKHLRHVAFELCLLGTGVLKGPFVFSKEYPRWTEDGTYEPKFENVPKITSVALWDFYPDPEAKNMADAAYTVERHRLNKTQLRELKQRPYFRPESIEKAIEAGPDYIPEAWESILEDNAVSVSNERYQVIEYWGMIDIKVAEESGLNIPKEFDDLDEVQINAWVCNSEVIRLVLNPFTPKRLPYHAVPYELNPYSFFGIGVAENMQDTQALMNGFMRLAVDNAALSGNVVLEVDETYMVPGTTFELFPGKIFRKQSGQTGQMVHSIDIKNVSNELMALYDKARQLADESTSMPSYAHGGIGVQGMGRTASGMSMLMGAAAQAIKSNVRNLDDYLLGPLGRDYFAFNMQFNFDKEFIGDLAVVAKGTESLMRNEIRSQRLLQFLQMTANPMDAPYVKRDYILREIAVSMDLDEDKLINDPREAIVRASLLKQMNDLQGIAPQGQAGAPTAGPGVSDPTGTGNGNIMPGNAPTPGAAGFTGAGGGDNGGNPPQQQ